MCVAYTKLAFGVNNQFPRFFLRFDSSLNRDQFISSSLYVHNTDICCGINCVVAIYSPQINYINPVYEVVQPRIQSLKVDILLTYLQEAF